MYKSVKRDFILNLSGKGMECCKLRYFIDNADNPRPQIWLDCSNLHLLCEASSELHPVSESLHHLNTISKNEFNLQHSLQEYDHHQST